MGNQYKPMFPFKGGGKEVFEYLKNALHLPEGVSELKISIKAGDMIRIKCKYSPIDVSEEQ